MKKTLYILMAAGALLLAACAKQNQALYPRTSVRCMGVELDGSQTLRVQGYGRNRADAREQAMKNAVYAVLFDGIREGAGGCDMRPLVGGANPRERHEAYFGAFFADKGAYRDYVSLADNRWLSEGKAKDKTGYAYDLTVRVLRPALKARLKADRIID